MNNDTRYDPIDHHRTTQPHAGVAFRNRAALPAFVLFAATVIALVGALASAGYMQSHWAGGFLVGALVIALPAIVLVIAERRRVHRNEALWLSQHEDHEDHTSA